MADKKPNGDAPFTEVRIEERKGKLCAVFFNSKTQDLKQAVIGVEHLPKRLESLESEEHEAPLTRRALELVKDTHKIKPRK